MTGLTIEVSRLEALAKREAGRLGEKLQSPIVLISPQLREAYARANASIKSLSLPNGPSFYKEAGAICHWIAKVKPFQFDMDDGRISDPQSLEVFPLNECIATQLAMRIINASRKAAIKSLAGKKQQTENFARLEENNRKFRQIDRDFVNNLRYGSTDFVTLSILFEVAHQLPIDTAKA